MMIFQGNDDSARTGLTRRTFLRTSSGVVALSVIGIDALRPSPARAQTSSGIPGVASQRIEGRRKVTGEKIYARDYNSRDLADHGWPDTQWYGMFLRARTVTRNFEGVDREALQRDARPTRIVLADALEDSVLAPATTMGRDCLVDEQIAEAAEEERKAAMLTEALAPTIGEDGDFDRPKGLDFDLVVRPGFRPNYLGQAVALLLFDNLQDFRAARRTMMFRGGDYQIYGPEIGPDDDIKKVLGWPTKYVRWADPEDPNAGFSYYDSSGWKAYNKLAKEHVQQIDAYLADTPDLITTEFACEMAAMDPMFMEPETGLVWHNRESGEINLLLGTQSPDGDVADVAKMYGSAGSPLNVTGVNLISCYPGGGFGGRDKSPFSLMIALCAAFSEGNPVRLEYDRFEQFQVGLKRQAARIKGSLAMTPDQKLQVVRADITVNSGGRKNLSPYVASLAALCAGGSYVVPRADIGAQAEYSEQVCAGSQRGFGGPQAFFAIETALDDIAAAQGWDAIEMRRRNALARGGVTVVGGPVDQELRLTEMLDIAAAHPLWAERNAIKAGYAQRGLTYGTGVAMSLQAYGTSSDGVVAAITLDGNGEWTVQSDAVDMGNGSATTLGVVIGDILGANAAHVEMGGYTLFGQIGLQLGEELKQCGQEADWSNRAYTKKSVGSSSACLTALHQVHVVQQCARAVFAQTVLPAARLAWDDKALEPWQVRWQDGALVMPGGDKPPLPLIEIAAIVLAQDLSRGAVAHAFFQQDWVSAEFDTASGPQRFKLDGLAVYPGDGGPARPIWRKAVIPPPANANRTSRTTFAPCVDVIGLTVDRRTGTVRVENAVSVLNAGRQHVPQLVSGQSQGGLSMAVGMTLMEDAAPDLSGPAGGEWNLDRYHVPRWGDVPLGTEYRPGGRAQELIVLPESPLDNGQGRGIAEAVMCSVAPAISNALRDATGVRFASLPITPAKILEGLGQ